METAEASFLFYTTLDEGHDGQRCEAFHSADFGEIGLR